MTANGLQHLAALADDAARYYRTTRPQWSRALAAAAVIARRAARHERREEQKATTLAGGHVQAA